MSAWGGGGTQERVPNDANGWNELTAMLLAAPVDLVVMEATGGYERGPVCAPQSAGVCVARINPRQVAVRLRLRRPLPQLCNQ